MRDRDHAALVRRMYAALSSGDVDGFLECLHEDVRWTVMGETALSGTYAGKRAVVDELLGAFPRYFREGLTVHVDAVHAADDHVVAELRAELVTHSGEPYRNRYCIVYRVEDGRVREMREYLDTQRLARALGE